MNQDYISQRAALRAGGPAAAWRRGGHPAQPAAVPAGEPSRAEPCCQPCRARSRWLCPLVAMGRLAGLGPVAAAALVLVLLRCGSAVSLTRRDLPAERNDRPIIGKGPRGRPAPCRGRAGGGKRLPERRFGSGCYQQRDAVHAFAKNQAYLREVAVLSSRSRDAEA